MERKMTPRSALSPESFRQAMLAQVLEPRSRLANVTAGGASPTDAPARRKGRAAPIPVPRVARSFQVKIASTREEWKEAFELVCSNYQARGYEAPLSSKVRFTPYHALPDTVTVIAKHQGKVVMTFTLVP